MYSTYAYWRISFGLCNALATFQLCMIAIFAAFVEEIMEEIMGVFFIHETSFDIFLYYLSTILH
jgi:hypothetical protein